MMLEDSRGKKLQDSGCAQAYEEITPEMNVIRAMIEARTSQNLTQKELSRRTGIAQAEISRLENGTRNPSIKLLHRLADGMGMALNVTFTPKEAATEGKKVSRKCPVQTRKNVSQDSCCGRMRKNEV